MRRLVIAGRLAMKMKIFAFALTNAITSTGKGVNLQGLQFCKLIDKSSPLLSNAINQNERLFIEIDLYRINKSGRWERYYYIQLRNASLTAIHVNISDNNLPTECDKCLIMTTYYANI